MAGYRETLNSRNYKFVADVEAFVTTTQKRIDLVVKQSTQEVVNQAQLPTAQGGRMRVDTGFLRASGQVSLNGMPSGPGRGERNGSYQWESSAANLSIMGAEPGATIWFGWTANYAKYREAYDGFLIAAVQNWQTIVNSKVAEIKSRFGNE